MISSSPFFPSLLWFCAADAYDAAPFPSPAVFPLCELSSSPPFSFFCLELARANFAVLLEDALNFSMMLSEAPFDFSFMRRFLRRRLSTLILSLFRLCTYARVSLASRRAYLVVLALLASLDLLVAAVLDVDCEALGREEAEPLQRERVEADLGKRVLPKKISLLKLKRTSAGVRGA